MCKTELERCEASSADGTTSGQCYRRSGSTVLGAAATAVESASPPSTRLGPLMCKTPERLDSSPSLVDCVVCALNCTIAEAPLTGRKCAFDSAKVPVVSLQEYVQRLSTSFECSEGCLVAALVFMDRFLSKSNQSQMKEMQKSSDEESTETAANDSELYYITNYNVHRLFLTCYVVSAKVNEDVSYGIPFYAKIGGIFARDLKRMENALLRTLEFDLTVSIDSYNLYEMTLREVGIAILRPQLASDKTHADVKELHRAVIRKMGTLAQPSCCDVGLSKLQALCAR